MDPRTSYRDRRALFAELAVVVSVLYIPDFVGSLFFRAHPTPLTLQTEVTRFFVDAGSVALIVYIVRRNGESLRHLGLRRTRWWAELLWAVLISVCAWFAYTLMLRVPRNIDAPDPAVQAAMGEDSAAYRILLAPVLLSSAVYEELFFRGYLWHRIWRLTGRTWQAVLVSTVLFTAYHPYRLVELLAVFTFGFVMALFRWQGGSLPRLILAHALFNLLIYLVP